jgi:hypothetical protein
MFLSLWGCGNLFHSLALRALALFYQPSVLVMGTYPDPYKFRAILDRESAVIDPYPHGPQLSDFFEMQRGM